MKVEFNTTQFEFSHGKKPRGNGNWVFFSDSSARFQAPHFEARGTFAESKKSAANWAKENGFNSLSVGS